MKLVIVQFDNAVDVSILPKGTTGIIVSDGTNTLSGGTIAGLLDMVDPQVVPHTHTAETEVSPAVSQ